MDSVSWIYSDKFTLQESYTDCLVTFEVKSPPFIYWTAMKYKLAIKMCLSLFKRAMLRVFCLLRSAKLYKLHNLKAQSPV